MGIDYRPLVIGDPSVSRVHRDTFASIVGRRLRAIMTEHNIYTHDLANWANVYRQTVIKCRTERRVPNTPTVINIAAALGIRISDLIPDNVYVNDRLPEQNVEQAWIGYSCEPFELSVEPNACCLWNINQYETIESWNRRLVATLHENMEYNLIDAVPLAEVSGLHFTTIYNVIDYKRIPTLPTLCNLCMALGCSIDYMIDCHDFLWV